MLNSRICTILYFPMILLLLSVYPKLTVLLVGKLCFLLIRFKVMKKKVLPNNVCLIAFCAGLLQSVSAPKGGT